MISVSEDVAYGRLIAAARILAGYDQGELATRAGLSGSTISNIERGRNSTPESLKSIRRALRQAGVNISFGNDMAMVGIAFVDRNAEDED